MNGETPVWPMALYAACVVALVAGMLLVSHLLGQRHRGRATGEPYESGIVSAGSARLRFSAKFYLIAMFFVIFDLEVAFLVAWAVAARDLGWAGFVEAAIFIAVLGVALIYLWRLGALDWGTTAFMKRRRRMVVGVGPPNGPEAS
jgi:NADH-quinone oxidoreductase subunit A